MSRDQTKAARYIQLLDEARCQGDWDEVPELVRKVRKHAPGRTCLTLTAEAEHAVSQTGLVRPSTARPSTARPSTAASTGSIGVSKYIPLLLEAIEKERIYVEDEFQAQVCLGWIHWQLGEPSLAAARLPKSIETEFAQLDGTGKESAEWTKVCALKASYIKGSSQNKTGAPTEALETFGSALPVLSIALSLQTQGKELRTWAELFLSAFCMVSSFAIKSMGSPIVEAETLSAFRAWAKFWETQGPASVGGRVAQAEVSRRRIWREYYITLSDLLQQELPPPTIALPTAYTRALTRLQHRAELKRVEERYESLLLSEVHFPKAEEGSAEVESFVGVLMQNWRVLCGSSWDEHDLGEGGAEGVSRGVLDILYRAATKTFHSTAILRHLFTVHLALAEFDLAFKAFDTYIEIVKKGKARVEKTGEAEPGLDDVETVLITASECIKALCRYGSREGAEKAKDLGQFFEDWLNKYYPTESDSNRSLQDGSSTGLEKIISPRTFALGWRCIGVAYAQWARLTFEASARGGIQLQAIKCFQNALLPKYESTTDAETLLALGTILAERRELATAIEVVKSGLVPPRSPSVAQSNGLGPHAGRFARERSLIPLWHLMALLLSARQEFITAARSCEGAFEQFQDPKNLFGDANLDSSYRSEHLNSNEKVPARTRGAVDDMEDFEKENVLQVKMTQLALIEVLEGPEVAVNASDELLSLYGRLFGGPALETITIVVPTTSSTAVPPRSSAGTIKSIKGSIFGRSNRSIKKSHPPSIGKSSTTLRPQTAQTTTTTRAPTIQVTNENGNTAKQHQHHHLTKDQPHPHEKQKRSESLSRKQGSLRKRSTSAGRKSISGTNKPDITTAVDGEKYFTPPIDSEDRDQWLNDDRDASRVGLAVSPDLYSSNSTKGSPPRPLPPKSQQVAHKEQSQSTDSDLVVAQENRFLKINPYFPTINPPTRFSKDQERRRRSTILVKVWLFIAGFYRRAAMYDDSRGAIEEAVKLVQIIDEEVSRDTHENVSMTHPGWGGGKSVAELWGDVYSELGALAVSESLPYVALARFESALNHFTDHPSAIVGLSNILLDIYTEDLLPPPAIPPLISPNPVIIPSTTTLNASATPTPTPPSTSFSSTLLTHQLGPLGLPSAHPLPIIQPTPDTPDSDKPIPAIENASPTLKVHISSKETSTVLLDRLAARDRAYGLLNGLTKLGTGWNYSEAWFALARAYELGGQADKAREVLWWCVELEEARAVRGWVDAGSAGGYVL